MRLLRIFHCGRSLAHAIVDAWLPRRTTVFLWRNLTPTAIVNACAALARIRQGDKPAEKPAPPKTKE
jgi:hypothetical protein